MAGLCPQYPQSKQWCPLYNKPECETERNGNDCVIALSVGSFAIMAYLTTFLSNTLNVTLTKEIGAILNMGLGKTSP